MTPINHNAHYSKLTAKERDKIVKLRKLGLTYETIAIRFSISYWTVRQAINSSSEESANIPLESHRKDV